MTNFSIGVAVICMFFTILFLLTFNDLVKSNSSINHKKPFKIINRGIYELHIYESWIKDGIYNTYHLLGHGKLLIYDLITDELSLSQQSDEDIMDMILKKSGNYKNLKI